MKHLNVLPAYLLAGVLLLAGCNNQSNDKDERIDALEQKIAQMEQGQVNVPSNAQSVSAVDPSTVGQFEFANTEFDFGTITEGKVVEHEFEFTNVGQAPLVISNVQASCGCTTPDWTKTPVKPGDKGFIKVQFNSAGKAGVQSPTVTIQANTSPSVSRLRLKGTVNSRSAAAPTQGPVRK
ncbi:MAG TPA: DUF1573 domain-containing protein [Cyclobacteriaceae bacterium]|nr:DUF1573 domain-containing protein [Cyclobacteriaceae bacterium]